MDKNVLHVGACRCQIVGVVFRHVVVVYVLQVKTVFNMTAKEGRKRSISCLVAVGNGNGAAGSSL